MVCVIHTSPVCPASFAVSAPGIARVPVVGSRGFYFPKGVVVSVTPTLPPVDKSSVRNVIRVQVSSSGIRVNHSGVSGVGALGKAK
jgi:hypothetical protein